MKTFPEELKFKQELMDSYEPSQGKPNSYDGNFEIGKDLELIPTDPTKPLA